MVDPNIKKKADDIRTKIKGKEVRESLASGLEEMSSDVVQNEGRQSNVEQRQSAVEDRQTDVENRFDDQIAGSTDIDEVIDARRPEGEEAYPTLRKRLDEEHQEVTAQLEQIALSESVTKVFEAPNPGDRYAFEGSRARRFTMKYDEFLEKFYDVYLGVHENGYRVSKVSEGKDESGQYDIYRYTFEPENFSKTIKLSSGMHTYELVGYFGLAGFIEQLMKKPYVHDGFQYLKENVRVEVIPIINPWGFNQHPKKYGNVNGVNINRNFDYDGMWDSYPLYSPDPSSEFYNETGYKGAYPFSEAETKILRDWVTDGDAEFWIDMHTGYSMRDVENYLYYLSDSEAISGINHALEKLRERARIKFGIEPREEIVIDSIASSNLFWSEKVAGVPAITLEQSPANTIWGGSSLNNDGYDIAEYVTHIATYVFELLQVSQIYLKEALRSIDNKIDETRLSLPIEKDTLDVLGNYSDEIIIDTFSRNSDKGIGKTEFGGVPWEISRGSYEIIKGKLVPTSLQTIATLDIGRESVKMSVEITFGGYAGIIQMIDPFRFISVRFNSESFALLNFGNEVLQEYSDFVPERGKTYDVTYEFNGRRLICYVDGDLAIDYEFSAFLTGYTKIGVRTSVNLESAFDNVVIKDFEKSDISFLSGWSGSVDLIRVGKDLFSLSGEITAGTVKHNSVILSIDDFALPEYGVPITVQTNNYQEGVPGLYLGSTQPNVFLRRPLSDVIQSGDSITFNTVYRA